ncbi:hypothetical protein [Sphingosinicella microcystinivorans]|uniref:hypothetical protein n=1 Tax=Sphingosinicella microcystinivorans TaxID=335406 RepID=UPI0022F3E013|nr:hypothetical protein [Sphingosinicella microcystinivorans]WBX84215.1 hypothetical protein PE061_20945 [Sphingosinicella microcystinivorans]
MLSRLSIAMAALALAVPAPAESKTDTAETAVEMTTPVFEMFRLAPGKTEAFIRSMAEWDKVSIAGGQPPTQLFLHAGGEGWDVLLYKPARPKPTPAQEAAMAAKIKELGLPTGALYFVTVREKMADHVHFEATGPITAEQWVAEIDRQRAEAKGRK